MPIRIAVLDDYQRVARSSADWTPLDGRADVTFFHDHITDPADLVRRLEPFDVVVAMRERTAFPAAILDRLPNLALLVTTGPFNAAHRRRGRTCPRDRGLRNWRRAAHHGRADLGPHHGGHPPGAGPGMPRCGQGGGRPRSVLSWLDRPSASSGWAISARGSPATRGPSTLTSSPGARISPASGPRRWA